MALKSTVFKAELQVADLTRNHYADYALTLARHPSETDERMMVRLLAYALHAAPGLEFGRGLSSADEPDLSVTSYSGEIELWIEVGLPDERTLKRAASRAAEVRVIAYGGRAADVWWEREAAALTRIDRLRILLLAEQDSRALAEMAERSMKLQCTVQEDQIWLSNANRTLTLEPRILK